MSSLRSPLDVALPIAFLVAACGPRQETVDTPSPTAPITAPTSPTVPPTASAQTGPEATVKTLFVSEQVVDCEGEGPRTCLQVRDSESKPWELFYDDIEGFTHEAGNAYELRVEVKRDGPRLRYELVEVVKKRPVAP